MYKIVFCGGGTGGHIMPIAAIARTLQKQEPFELHYVGLHSKESFAILEQEGFLTHPISTGKIRRYFSLKNIRDILWNIPLGFVQSIALLRNIKPNLVFSKGGTGSLPVAWAAHWLKIPLFTHESDAVLGLSNKKAFRWAEKIFTSFPGITGILVGNPIRQELVAGSRKEAEYFFGLESDKPVLLIIGGSQGAQRINQGIFEILNDLLKAYQVIHVVGPQNSATARKGYHVYQSLNEQEMANAYAAAGIIISRAGSSSIFEIAVNGKPSILIPLPEAAQNHQLENANIYSKTGAAIMIQQKNLSWETLVSALDAIQKNYGEMKKAALNFAKPDAAQNISDQIITYLHEKR